METSGKNEGAGSVKFLKHKTTKKVCLLICQSKTLKICANHLFIPTMTVQEHAGNDKSCVWHAAILLMANSTMNSSERSEQDMVMEGRCWCEANEKHLSSALFHSLMWRSLVRIAAWVLACLCDTLCHCIDRLAIARFRQYGLWERYTTLYPDGDLVFTVGESDYRKDWFFAHVTRKKDDNTYEKTTWTIKFKLNNVNKDDTYKLRLALASAQVSDQQVRVNDPNEETPLFSTGIIGGDNAIARHGIHGLSWLFNIDIPGVVLISNGENAIYLTQANGGTPFRGVMYDYIRLEGSAISNDGNENTFACI
ncbi:hypothetical protein E3N88_45291 [Mikania micrantha]|uniref:RanBD1 domain-containing protein n=1 Tax=Mikania micrantha TaxID=192012 RepID=A0A5N6L9K3_9ASTR|nr:hypothetical protein E3N88_45291 [Mikania micrantha]